MRGAGVGSELDRPLGQNRGNGRRSDRPRLIGWRGVLGLCCAGVVLAGSVYTALLPDNLSDGGMSGPPGPAAQSAALSKATEAVAASPAAGNARSGSGKPAQGAPQDGMSGATVAKTLTSSGVTVTKIAPGQRAGNGPVLIEAGRQIGQDPHLATQPDPELFEQTKYGRLPVRSDRGARPMDVYARPSPDSGTRIAIVVGGLGLSQTGTLNAIDELPDDVTLAFAATGNSLQRWMQAARRAGHEILLQVPMEPFGYPDTNPGPHTLTVKGGKEEEMANLHYAMGRLTNYTGIMNYMGGRFMSDAGAMEPVMRDVASRGLLFLDDGSSGRSLAGKLAKPLAVPFAQADLQIDSDLDRGAILKKLNELEQLARRNGQAIGVASAFDTSVQAIATWANEAKARGIEIVGVSALVDDPEHRQ